MKKALFIALKEVKDFLQDKGDLAFSILLPILIFGLMYGAFGNNLQFNGTANIVNEDPGKPYSGLLIQRLKEYKGVTVQTLNAAEADRKLKSSAIQMALYIPSGFSDALAANQLTQLTFKQRGNGGTEGQIIANLVKGVAEGITRDLQIKNQVKSDLSLNNINPQQIEITVQNYITQSQANPSVKLTETSLRSSPDPVNQFLPGILTMFVLFAINMTAQTLVEERRKGTLERLMATRLTTGQLFTGKFLAYTARGFLQTTVLILLAYAVFQLFTPLTFLETLVLALIFAAACSTIGLILGSISRTQNQATWIGVFFTMVMVMLSGTFIPITEGTVLHTLSKFSVNTYANDAFRAIISQGASLGDIKIEILVLAGITVAGLIISRFLFRATQGGK
jgi:ABC-type multidrug transport system permease subunit